MRAQKRLHVRHLQPPHLIPRALEGLLPTLPQHGVPVVPLKHVLPTLLHERVDPGQGPTIVIVPDVLHPLVAVTLPEASPLGQGLPDPTEICQWCLAA
eukprot:CAMPEP_0198596950 /NCGR_PEP_ID=MMETSP1462-20131121/143847_1 /TAXON_ID=1333877 /ORGANISM="Brandtodinium nutriculum, Strain RCC3387" /LENGTH=97 /DNA_ID=CAMNT_0044328601 /DNA_START=194 /DNA_END=483 /DNA_ORIENTATION=+